MSVKLKTFEDIWKTKIEDRSRKHESEELVSGGSATETRTQVQPQQNKGNKKGNQEKNDQNKMQYNGEKSDQSSKQKQQVEKQNGLLNERDWEYLDKLGEKFRILEEKSSNYQKNFQNSINKMKKGDEEDQNYRMEKDSENNLKQVQSKQSKQSPVKNEIKQMKQNTPHSQQKYLNQQRQDDYDQTIPKQEQFKKNKFEQQNKSTQRLGQQSNFENHNSRPTVRNNYLYDSGIQNGGDEQIDYDRTIQLQGQEKQDYECTFLPGKLKNSQISNSQSDLSTQSYRQRALTPNHLYEDALMRKQKQEVIEKLVIQETKKQTNQSKIGVNSQKIILKKIEEFLQALIVSIEQDEENVQSEHQNDESFKGQEGRKVLKFEGVGYFFQQLGIFRSVKFEENENGEISISQIRELNNIEIDRMKAEMTFHEELWKVMSIDQLQYKDAEEIENVPSKLLFDITMVLLEIKLTPQQSELLLNEIILTNLFEDNINRGQEVIDIYFSVSHNWSLETLVKQFRQIFDDKTSLMDFYANWNKRLTIQSSTYENSEMSFHPQINQRSRVMDSAIQQSKSVTNQKRHDILFEQHKLKQERQQQQKVEKLQKEVEKCTFKPQTNPQKNKEKQNLTKNGYQDSAYEEEDSAQTDQEKRYEQLFKIHNRKQNQIKEIQEYVEFYKQEQELEHCTFKPQTSDINREMLNQGQMQNIKGLNQQLQRMYKARKDKLEKEMFFEKQRYTLSQQNQKQGVKKVVPFSFENRQNQKKTQQPQEQRKLLGHIDINISKTKKGRVTLHEGDDASTLAQNFAKIYNISSEMSETLAVMLQQYLDKYTSTEQE